MTNLYIDLETIPPQNGAIMDFLTSDLTPPKSYKKKEVIDKWFEDNKAKAIDKASCDGTYGEVCTIGWAIDDGEIQSFQRTGFDGITEKELIEAFFIEIKPYLSARDTQIKPVWTAHNKDFDLRFLFLRSVILQAQLNGFIIPVNDRYNRESFCTMQAWRGLYNKSGGSLKSICKVLGIKCKDGMTGADVWPAYQNCEYDKIEDYCRDDVKALREVYKRLTPYIEV